MKKTRQINLFIVFVAVTLLVPTAGAVAMTILPESSHYQGRVHYYSGSIEYAVYDTSAYPDEFIGADGFAAPGSGRYIYAYQILTDDTSTFPVEYFAIAGIAEGALAEPVNDNIGSVNDSPDDPGQEGVQPDSAYITSSSTAGIMGAWEFDDSLLVEGQHSYFLVLRSDADWGWGTYTFSDTLANQPPVPGSLTNPEPSTIALLGFGMLTLLRRRRPV
jgi:hypothetical protein